LRDTSQAFPTTRWSHILADPEAGSQGTRDALETLAQRYWRPIAAYARAKFASTDDEAREAAQDFFLWMMESGFLGKADPDRGSFRGFVKRSLVHFLHDRERRRRTEKRGGGRRFVPIDGDETVPHPPDPGKGPEEHLDDLWRRELLAQATDALEAELRAKGKDVTFEVFRDFYLEDQELDYEAVGARHGITKVDVSNQLQHAKARFRAHVRSAVLETVGGDEDLRAELAWLFQKGGRR
jgi:RNA polymerase sigma-70 factor (ECF subfamily)